MKRVIQIVALMALTQAAANSAEFQTLQQQFEHPPDAYKPMPLWFINGELTTEGNRRQLTDARQKAGFTGVSPLPKVDVEPPFLSDAYVERYQDILDIAERLGMQVIFYDDTGFPSGSGGRSVFIPKPDKAVLAAVPRQHLPAPNVDIVLDQELPEGPAHVSYIHKVKEGRDIFYFANSTDVAICADIRLREHFELEVWNHTPELSRD